MGRWRDGGCQEVGGEKLEKCYKEYGQLAASKEGLGSKRAVVPMMMMMMKMVR